MPTFIARHGEIRPEVVLASDQIRAVEDPCGRRDERREECVHDEHHHGDEAAERFEGEPLRSHRGIRSPHFAFLLRRLNTATLAREEKRIRDAEQGVLFDVEA